MTELKTYKFLGTDEIYPYANLGNDYYLKYDVDRVIFEKDKEIDSLKATIKDTRELLLESQKMHKRCADNAVKEIRRLRRALWVTRANFAKAETDRWESHVDCGNRRNRKDPAFVKTGKLLFVGDWRILWAKIERKCRAMAEKFKEAE